MKYSEFRRVIESMRYEIEIDHLEGYIYAISFDYKDHFFEEMIAIDLEEGDSMQINYYKGEQDDWLYSLSKDGLKVLNMATELALTPIDERGDIYEI